MSELTVTCLHSINWSPIAQSGSKITQPSSFIYEVEGDLYVISDVIPPHEPLILPYSRVHMGTGERNDIRLRLRAVLEEEVEKRKCQINSSTE